MPIRGFHMADQVASQPANVFEQFLASPFVKNASMMWGGRRRVISAIQTVWNIEASYRHSRSLVEGLEKEAKKAFFKNLHRKNAESLAELCKSNGASWVKLAQFMSSRPDILPREYIQALQPLQNDNPPVDFSQLTPVLETELDLNWRDQIVFVDETPVATASIAQVHKAQLADGRWVALKIQLPKIHGLFKQDFMVFRFLAKTLNPRIKQIDVEQMTDLLIATTKQELDFTIEAKNLIKFAEFSHVEGIEVPKVLPEFSTSRVLVTEWIDGERLTDKLDRSNHEEAKNLLKLLSQSFMQQVTQFGFFQADPHAGNFMVDHNDHIWILDFGTVGELSQEQIQNYLSLFYALMNRQTDNLAILLKNAGFSGIESSTIDRVTAYIVEASKKEKKVNLDEAINELIDQLQELRVTIPDDFVVLGRVLATLGGLTRKYKVGFRGLM